MLDEGDDSDEETLVTTVTSSDRAYYPNPQRKPWHPR